MTEKVYEISVAAQRLGISVSSIYRMWYNGQIELKRRGPRKGYRVPESEIERLEKIQAQRAEVWGGIKSRERLKDEIM
jgi:predicted site-specific integrase-resolvase